MSAKVSKTAQALEKVKAKEMTIGEAAKFFKIAPQTIYVSLSKKFGGGLENRQKQVTRRKVKKLASIQVEGKAKYSPEEIAKRCHILFNRKPDVKKVLSIISGKTIPEPKKIKNVKNAKNIKKESSKAKVLKTPKAPVAKKTQKPAVSQGVKENVQESVTA